MNRILRAAAAVLLAFAALLAACGPRDVQSPAALAGHWEGSVAWRDATLPVDLDVEAGPGATVARLTVPALLVREQAVEGFEYRSPRLRFRFPVGGETWTFDGWFRRNMVVGTFSGGSLPRTFNRSTLPQLGLRRVPKRPDPYAADTVRFAGGAAALAGTVYVPADSAADSPAAMRPAVVLLATAAGETRAARRELADRFARAGFVALAYDARGCGASAGAPAGSYADLELDAAEAAEYLRGRADVDPERVGLCGAGPGALLVPRVALRVHTAFAAAISPAAGPPGRRGGQAEWAGGEHDADPAAPWGALTAPALVLLGERDRGRDAAGDAARLRASFAAGGQPRARVDVVRRADGALLLETAFGEAYDFPRAAPGGLDTLLAWARRQSGLPPVPPPLVPPMR